MVEVTMLCLQDVVGARTGAFDLRSHDMRSFVVKPLSEKK